MPKLWARRQISAPMCPDSHHAERAIGKVQMPAVDLADEGGAGGEVRAARFSADRLPMPGPLLVAVQVQVPCEAQHEPQHVVGDHVGVKAAHVAQPARMLDERVEHVVLEAGRRGLHPAQLSGPLQQGRSDLAEEGVGIDDLGQRRGFVGRVDDRHGPRGLANQRQPPVFDGRKENELHADLRREFEDVVKWLRRDFATRKKTFRNVLALKNGARQNGRRRVDNFPVSNDVSGPLRSVGRPRPCCGVADRRQQASALLGKRPRSFFQVPLQSFRNQEAAKCR